MGKMCQLGKAGSDARWVAQALTLIRSECEKCEKIRECKSTGRMKWMLFI